MIIAINELNIQAKEKKFSIRSIKPKRDDFFNEIYAGYWYISNKYLPNIEVDIIDTENNIM